MPSLTSLRLIAVRLTAGALKTLSLWHARARERRGLAGLDDHLLRDIGLTRDRALGEARRAPWRGGGRVSRRAVAAEPSACRQTKSGAAAPLR